jgi:uncharacterized membrane protein required for colicin V production
MVFSIILMVLTLVVAYFHYAQGFFSSTISLILCMFAAVVAIGYHEQVAQYLFVTKMYDQANSIALVLLFAACYIIPRLIMDALIPGNVRFPFLVDQIGAGITGLLAGLISVGILAIAAEELPFGITLGMYSRYELASHEGEFMGRGQMEDTMVTDAVKADKLDPDDPTVSHVWFHQDDLVNALEKKVTGDGSLGNDKSYVAYHPDLLTEIFGQRIGLEDGAKRTAAPVSPGDFELKAVYLPAKQPPLPQVDGDMKGLRDEAYKVPATVQADPDQVVLVVRATINGKPFSDDKDSLLRFSTSGIRLCAGNPEAGAPFKDYYPIGTLDPRGVVVAQRPDDYLFLETASPRTVDFVFVVDKDNVMNPDDTKPPFHFTPGAFVEFKRYAVADLSDATITPGLAANSDKGLVQKSEVEAAIAAVQGAPMTASAGASADQGSGGNSSAGGAGEASGGGQAVGDTGLTFLGISASDQLFAPINCGSGDESGQVQLPSGVGGVFTHRAWTQLSVSSDKSVKELGTPVDDNIQKLGVDTGNVLVQVHCHAPTTASPDQNWAWTKHASEFVVEDANGHSYKCAGVWASVQRSAQLLMVADYGNFDTSGQLREVQPVQGRPVEVWLAFAVPSGTQLTDLRLAGNSVAGNLNYKAP